MSAPCPGRPRAAARTLHPAPGRRPASFSAAELVARGADDVPAELVSSTHLVYSSPAALAFNSPGAEGFGVKRAGLAVPGSVMLVVSPACCGRNTSCVSELPGYEHRFFYLQMGETDLITARHLRRIPEAVCAVVESLPERPSVVMVCITCVDALLGTDMERVCRKAEEAAGVRVRPCYMYALTREGRKPPMVNVRQSIYSLLEPRRRDPRACNLLGHFAPVDEASELRAFLRDAGLRHVREVSSAASYDEFQRMAEANFNLVLDPEAGPAAQDLQERLGTPWIELRRFYGIGRIERQYEALAAALGTSFDQAGPRERAASQVRAFCQAHPGEVVAVGECCNADPFELALALVGYGLRVAEVFCTVTPESFAYLRAIAKASPETRFFSNLEPTMVDYSPAGSGVTLTIGRDAGYYHPECPNLPWNADRQPFGYEALEGLFSSLSRLLAGKETHTGSSVSLDAGRAPGEKDRAAACRPAVEKDRAVAGDAACPAAPAVGSGPRLVPAPAPGSALAPARRVRGLSRYLTPFAPDQSGAVSVLYGLGGMSVVIDAGGCVGNICGFDEPRWLGRADAVFSAGLRDMDAILGRDDLLVRKLADATRKVDASFVALVSTPVPSVIGTDLNALRRMAERACGLPTVCVDTDGMRPYDSGAEKAYLALLATFAEGPAEEGARPAATMAEKGAQLAVPAGEKDARPGAPAGAAPAPARGRLNVLGCTPMDLSCTDAAPLRRALEAEGWREVALLGMDATLDDVRRAGTAERSLVVSPSGLAAARWLERRFGVPYDVGLPLADALVPDRPWEGARVLVVHQQVAADSIRRVLLARGASEVACATFFMQPEECRRPGDLALRDEADFAQAVADLAPDVVLADAALRQLVPGFAGAFYDETHFALSGHLAAPREASPCE